jgi:hypothetical protein
METSATSDRLFGVPVTALQSDAFVLFLVAQDAALAFLAPSE